MAFKGPMVLHLERGHFSLAPALPPTARDLGEARESRGIILLSLLPQLALSNLIKIVVFFLKNTVFSDYLEHRIVVEILEENRMKKL